jgi:type I restriction enzyme M protein
VPEGIIFQSQTAYKDLRKMLVENSLVAVVSLPAGVFNPYSGVKTSILILDKSLAKKSDTVAFFKVENDGFGLGAQRREVSGEQLTQVKIELAEYLRAVRNQVSTEDLLFTHGLIVPKIKLTANDDYNFSGERYRESELTNHIFPLVKIGDICSTSSGGTPLSGNSSYYESGKIPWLRSGEVAQGEVCHSELFITEEGLKNSSAKIFPVNTVLVAMYGATAGAVGILRFEAATNQAVCGIIPDERLSPDFLYLFLKANKPLLIRLAGGGAQPNISQKIVREIEIPLPPIAIQKEIVTEIESYQKVINGARAVIDNYRPHIAIDPDWEIVKLCDVTESISDGDHMPPPKAENGIPFITISNIDDKKQIDFTKTFFVPEEYYADLKTQRRPQKGDILYTVTGSYGIPVLMDSDIRFCFQRHIGLIRPSSKINTRYLYYLLSSRFILRQADDAATGVAQKTVSLSTLRNFSIPLPSLETQQAIVDEIEAEQNLVNANRELITRFEKKIQTALNKIWGEG